MLSLVRNVPKVQAIITNTRLLEAFLLVDHLVEPSLGLGGEGRIHLGLPNARHPGPLLALPSFLYVLDVRANLMRVEFVIARPRFLVEVFLGESLESGLERSDAALPVLHSEMRIGFVFALVLPRARHVIAGEKQVVPV